MIPTIIFILSIGIQLTVAVFALLLIRTTGRKLAWILIALAMVLMAGRRLVSFFSLIASGKEITFEIPEFISLAISCLMLIGVLRIGDYFRSVRLAEEKIRKSEEKYRMIVENINEVIYMITVKDNPFAGKVEFVSGQSEKIIGYSPEDFLRESKLWSRIIHPDDMPAVVEITEEMVKSRKRVTRYYRLYHKERSEYIWLEDRVMPIVDSNNVVGFFGVARDITERIRTEEALQKNEEYLKAIFNSVRDGIFTLNMDRKFIFCNRAAEMMFGYSLEEIAGKSTEIFHVDRKAYEVFGNRLYNDIKEKGYSIGEYTLKRKNGEIFPIEYSISMIKNEKNEHIGLVGIIMDITERKRTEEIRAFLANITEHATDAIVGLDLDTNIVSWNRGAERIFGYSAEEVVGKSWSIIVPKEALEACRERFKRVTLEGAVETVETVRLRKDGKEFPAEMTLTVLKDERGNHIGFVSITREITERRKLEEQLRHAQKMQAIGQLAGGIAHEFNNILTAIIGYGNILMMNMKEDDPLRHNVKRILASSERAANLTKGLLTYSRKQITNPIAVNINEIVRRIGELLLKIIGEDIELRTLLADEDLTVMADTGQIDQVLLNLATNARDAMPDGGVITIETRRVKGSELGALGLEKERMEENSLLPTKNSGQNRDFAEITVTDTGMGMDKESRERIFDPFFTTKDVGKGTGLGLAIVYGIIKQHNGYINCYSEPGKGTTLRIYLPLCISDLKTSEGIVPEFEIKDSEQIKGGTETVLVAEDDKALRKLIKTVLKEFGYNVIDAVDGEDAVGKFIENKDSIKLLVLDVIMPKKNGREVYEEIRKVRPDIKALFTSGYDRDIIHRKGILEEGINFIPKPVSPRELARKVREILDR